ncbi:hypothetical protein DACRYDRAFT_107501 [Dacryopinax primogenitus]|uniref:Myb-like domain-containing protein n=1 Tax=Dacryopinax primogenitus (strain DJM 731) TaxID=1858805 RepID=M5FZ31_DACPD|nr:uncharacterized protein DACRYDRAFT_107501 [Dacryopinax primogenitus]EJU01764.1 hypothetical protein DACRYDRAFT_107501 [Dacryopinax primogenitus]
METRSADQCAKRWTDVVNPDIDHSPWNPEEDKLLLKGVNECGNAWVRIARESLPRRSGLAAKNRYNVLKRAEKKKAQRKTGAAVAGRARLTNQQTDETALPQSNTTCSVHRQKKPLPQTPHHVESGKRRLETGSPRHNSSPHASTSSRPSFQVAADLVRYGDPPCYPHGLSPQIVPTRVSPTVTTAAPNRSSGTRPGTTFSPPNHTTQTWSGVVQRSSRPQLELPYFKLVEPTLTAVTGSEQRPHHPRDVPAGRREVYSNYDYQLPPAGATPYRALPTPPAPFPPRHDSGPPQQHASREYRTALPAVHHQVLPPRAPDPPPSRSAYYSPYEPSSSSIPYHGLSYPRPSYYGHY